jgi:hypothetical protein
MAIQEVIRFVNAALECSVYIAPREPGLTREEVFEVARRVGFQNGEIGDAFEQASLNQFDAQRFLPNANAVGWHVFMFREDPEYRNVAAFDFVLLQLLESIKADGVKNAKLDRDVIVERWVGGGKERHDVEVAIRILLLCGQVLQNGGVLRLARGRENQRLPSKQIPGRGPIVPKPDRRTAYPLVKDVLERRTDGRPKNVEALDAFAEALDGLGYGPFRLWWKQIVAELRRSDPQTSPVSVSVLAAAIVEAAHDIRCKARAYVGRRRRSGLQKLRRGPQNLEDRRLGI